MIDISIGKKMKSSQWMKLAICNSSPKQVLVNTICRYTADEIEMLPNISPGSYQPECNSCKMSCYLGNCGI